MHHARQRDIVESWVMLLVALLFALSIGGCGALDDPGAFNRTMATTIQATDNVVTSTRTLLRAGKITADDAENVLKAAEVARDGIKVAREAHAKNPTDTSATARLRIAADAMDGFGAYLTMKGK